MTATRAEVERLHREGMADACVLLVAHRVMPSRDLDERARPLGLSRVELQDAVRRFKARAEALRPKPKPARRLHVVRAGRELSGRYTNKKPCPKGCGRTFVHFGKHLTVCQGAAT